METRDSYAPVALAIIVGPVWRPSISGTNSFIMWLNAWEQMSVNQNTNQNETRAGRNEFEDVVCRTATILRQSPCVNWVKRNNMVYNTCLWSQFLGVASGRRFLWESIGKTLISPGPLDIRSLMKGKSLSHRRKTNQNLFQLSTLHKIVILKLAYVQQLSLLLKWINFSTTCVSNYIYNNVWNEITYFPNINGCMVEVWKWIRNFIPHFTWHLITYLCWDLS